MGNRACGHGSVARPCRGGYALGTRRYLTWLKSHLVLSHPVVMFIFCKGDSHSAHGDEVPSILSGAKWNHAEGGAGS